MGRIKDGVKDYIGQKLGKILWTLIVLTLLAIIGMFIK